MTAEVAAHLKEAGVGVKPYGAVLGDIEAAAEAGTRMWMDPSQVPPLPALSVYSVSQGITAYTTKEFLRNIQV